jgi:hypothetical protein
MGTIDIDRSDPEVLTVRFRGTVEDAVFQAYLDVIAARVQQGKRYALLIDALEAGVPSPPQRRMQSEFTAKHQKTMVGVCCGIAFVISSPLIRGALTAMLWFQPMPVEHAIVGEVDEGRRWCRAQLSGATPAA